MKIKKQKKGSSAPEDETDELFDESYSVAKKWFEEVDEDPKEFPTVSEQILIELKDEAKKCHDSEVANYNIKNSKTNPNFQWMKTVMSKGTVSDRIAAHTVAVQDDPICNIEILRNLVGMVKVGKKQECISVIETLTELFLLDILPPNKKLRPFHKRPLSLLSKLSSGNAITRRKLLSTWYFEDQLKEIYTSFVLALNTAAQDTVDSNKEKAISAMYKLLAGHPEQEKNLLAYIVNKLGDPSQKVASKAIYCLGQLLNKHPNMQGVVLQEVEKLLFRPNISPKAQYYGLCFLSQFYLNHEDSDIARKLIELYFSFFKACIKKGEVDSRMMSALLMGVNRAYPYAKLEMDKISEHIDTMYRVVHIANFNVSLHALTLLYQVSDYTNTVTDRFYSALYRKLVDPHLATSTHQAMLLSLIYKALLKDKEVNRVKALVKRLLQLSLYLQPSYACGILYLVSQLIAKKGDVQSLILKQTLSNTIEDDGDDDEKYHDVKEEPFEEIEIKKEIEDKPDLLENSGEPIQINDEDNIKPDVEELDATTNGGLSWYHCENSSKKENKLSLEYRPLSRNPLYAGAEHSAYLELVLLRLHFHPTVSLYAQNILSGNTIQYSGDPLKDFTLIRFLDRFVFKNPKKVDDDSKQGAHPTFGKRKVYQPKGIRAIPVKSLTYIKENQKNIPVDELFLHVYLQQKYKDKEIKKEDDDSDLESVDDNEFEDMLNSMYGADMKEDDELDFMTDIGDSLQKKDKKNKKGKPADGSDDEEEKEDDESLEDLGVEEDIDEEDVSDDDENFEKDKDLFEDLDDDDDEDIVFGGSSDEEQTESNKKVAKKSKSKKSGNDLHSLFASADEFATLLEDEGSSKTAPGGSNAYANKDNANVKQIAWEDKRNRWLKGYNSTVGKDKKGKKFGKKNDFSKKRPNSSKFGNKNKKFKK